MNNKDIFFKKIQNMHEDDFSKSVIMPLLKKIGYQYVDFNGGPYELGKDIIAHRLNEFDDIEVTVIQSKMFKSNRTSESSQIFSTIVHQLSLCLSKKIPCSDGIERLPKKTIFITPFTVDTRHLSEQIEKIQLHGISIFDQVKLTSLLDKYWPEAFNQEQNSLEQAIKLQQDDISNLELYRALHIESKTVYSNYYSDLNFFVGETESREVFSSNIVFTKTHHDSHDESEWLELKKADGWIKEYLKQDLIHNNIDKIEEDYNSRLSEYNSESNQDIIHRLSDAKSTKQSLTQSLFSEISNAKNIISTQNTISKSKKSLTPTNSNTTTLLANTIETIELLARDFSNKELPLIEAATQKQYIKNLKDKKTRSSILDIGSLAKELINQENLIEKLEKTRKPYPAYKVTLCEKTAENHINIKIKELSKKLTQLNNNSLTISEARTILDTTNQVLRCINNLTKHLKSTSLRVTLEKDTSFANQLDVSAHTIFDSGCNIAVYGDAGAGKSTTLYVYAEKIYQNKKDNEEVLFIPLNRVTSKLGKISIDDKNKIIDTSNNFNSLINAFLLYKDIEATADNRNLLINSLSKKNKVTIIIDALDESADNSSWIIPALSEIPKNIGQAQVITSSRNCVNYIKEIEFLGITLLPFNREQLKKFIFGWLNNQEKCEELWSSIQNNDLFEVAKNPLLATIICTLHENGIPVPENEPDVYRRKIELLCGLYDQNKGIRRAKNEKSFLEKCCQKIAYQMHVRSRREATIDELRSFLNRGLESRVSTTVADSAVDDLVNVCNILIKSADSNSYSFWTLENTRISSGRGA
ncbi:NACHT domain-containing protein [Pseudomonas saponiphila]